MILGVGPILARGAVVPLIEGELESAVTVKNSSALGRTIHHPWGISRTSLHGSSDAQDRDGFPNDAFLNQFCGDGAK